MPRGRPKEILHTACFEQAAMRGRRRICQGDRQNHSIPPGSWCLIIKNGLEEKSYCLECARKILERGRVKLDSLCAALDEAESDM